MKKLLAIVLAALMIAACSVTAFAETTNVSYNVDPSYTVAIPASVTLSDADVTADVTASDVILESGKKIKVELTSASNTASGSTFNAKNGDSTVTYTITGDKAIAVGDTVATFTANGSKTLTFSAADKSAATVAGAHTETLTFTVKVESAAVAVTGVSLDKDTLELTAGGDSATLRASVAPDDATDKTVTWESSDTSVATVADGVVTPVAAGTATITAKAGDETATCAVTVTPAVPEYYNKLTKINDNFGDQVYLLKKLGRGRQAYNSSLTAAQAYALATYQAAIDGKPVYVIMSSQDDGYEIHYAVSTDAAAAEHTADLYNICNDSNPVRMYYIAQ